MIARSITVLASLVLASAWWAWPAVRTDHVPSVAPAAPPVRRSPPRPAIPTTLPPPIREAPTRTDGLDRVDPCAVPETEETRRASLSRYLHARRDELEQRMQEATLDAIGARLRGAASAPSTDTALAVHYELAVGASRARRFDAALLYAYEAVAVAPDDPIGPLLVRRAARGLVDRELERAALVRAFRLSPRDPDLALGVADALALTSDVMTALEAAEAALDVRPTGHAIWLRAHLAARAFALDGALRRTRGATTVVAPPDVASDAVERALIDGDRITRGEPSASAHELVVWVYPSDAVLRRATCAGDGTPHDDGNLAITRDALSADADGAMIRERIEAVVRDRVRARETTWIFAATLARAAHEPEDLAAYAALVRRGAWIPPAALRSAIGRGGTDERLARAESRAIFEWLWTEAHPGEGLADLFRDGGGPDPTERIAAAAGVPFDEPTLLAFMARRAHVTSAH